MRCFVHGLLRSIRGIPLELRRTSDSADALSTWERGTTFMNRRCMSLAILGLVAGDPGGGVHCWRWGSFDRDGNRRGPSCSRPGSLAARRSRDDTGWQRDDRARRCGPSSRLRTFDALSPAAYVRTCDRHSNVKRLSRGCRRIGRHSRSKPAGVARFFLRFSRSASHKSQCRSMITAAVLIPSAADQIRPSCASMMRRATERLNPHPPRHSSKVVSLSSPTRITASMCSGSAIAIHEAGFP